MLAISQAGPELPKDSVNLPSYPPGNHQCSDVVKWRGGGQRSSETPSGTQIKYINVIYVLYVRLYYMLYTVCQEYHY